MNMGRIPFERWYRTKLKEERLEFKKNKTGDEPDTEESRAQAEQQRIAQEFKLGGLKGLLQPHHKRNTAKIDAKTGRMTLQARMTIQDKTANQHQPQSPKNQSPRHTRPRLISVQTTH